MPRLVFEKAGDSVWISHLDLMRVFQRAFHRAGLLLKHSQGFNPRAIVSIALPLSVGVESTCELLDFELERPEPVTPERLNAVLPRGIRVLDVLETGRKLKELTHLSASVTLTYDHGVPEHAAARIRELFRRERLVLEKRGKKGVTETDILPMISQLEVTQADDCTIVLNAVVCAQNPSLNPQQLAVAVELYLPELTPDAVNVRRMEILDREGRVFR